MSNQALDQFGRLLMMKVRDEAISDWKMIVDGRMKGEESEQIRTALRSFTIEQRSVFLSLVPEVVDTVLHHLLFTLEQSEDVKIRVTSDGIDVPDLKDLSDGLAGELYSDEGWIARFSRETS